MIFRNNKKSSSFNKEFGAEHYSERFGKAFEIYEVMMTSPPESGILIEGKYPLSPSRITSQEKVNLKVLEKINQKDLYQFLLEAHQFIENPKWQPNNRDSMKVIVTHFLHQNGIMLYEDLVNRLGSDGIPEWLWKALYYANWEVQLCVFRDIPTKLFDQFVEADYWRQVPVLFLAQAIQRIQEREDYWGSLPAELIQELVFDKR